MNMLLHGSNAPRFIPPTVQRPSQLPSGNSLGVALKLNTNTGNGMNIGMLGRIKNARPGCSSCGGGAH
jgi:hypothetical protein